MFTAVFKGKSRETVEATRNAGTPVMPLKHGRLRAD